MNAIFEMKEGLIMIAVIIVMGIGTFICMITGKSGRDYEKAMKEFDKKQVQEIKK